MYAEYKRDMNHNYLILGSDTEVDTSSYQIRILAGSMLDSLLKCHFQGIDGTVFFHYEITSRQSVALMFEQKKLGMDSLQLIFGGFVQAMEEMAEYLLNPEQLVIRPEYMYLDLQKQKLQFCYLPGYEKDVKEQFQALTEYILPRLDHKDERAVMLGYGVYRRAMEETFHLEYVKEELYRVTAHEKQNFPVTEQKEEFFQIAEEKPLQMKKNHHLENDEKHRSAAENGPEVWNFEKKEKGKAEERRKIGIYAAVSGIMVCIMLGILAASLYGFLPWIRVETLLGLMLFLLTVWVIVCFLVHKLQKKESWKEQAAQRKQQRQNPEHSLQQTISGEWEELLPDEEERDGVQKAGYKQQQSERFEESDNLMEHEEGCGETVVLSAESHQGPASLVSKEPGELATIYLEKELTVIGKLETASDAVIPIPTVSRVHAKIRKKEKEYYLADLNSRNGTAINGKMLSGGEEWLLQDGDEVDFAQARYIFLK